MKIQIVDNRQTKLVNYIRPVIAQSIECRIAVAFISKDGISCIEEALRQCLQKGGYVELLVGLDLIGTDPDSLWALHDMSKTESHMSWYCLSKVGKSSIYHPKLYIMQTDNTVTLVIGSSNLTKGGLDTNIEANALIQASPFEEIVSDTYSAYNALKNLPERITPDQEYLSLYEELYGLHKKHDRRLRQNKLFEQISSRLQEKAATLPKPIITSRDLYGWQKLVFDKLPSGPFRTRDIYQFEKEFSTYYPENRNIKPKIRQILQQLRDLNMIRHIGRETWIKLE